MDGLWQLQDAKNRLSRVVEQAAHDGPQTITVRGRPAVVVLSVEEYMRLTRGRGQLSEFFAGSPLRGAGLETPRSQDASRDVSL